MAHGAFNILINEAQPQILHRWIQIAFTYVFMKGRVKHTQFLGMSLVSITLCVNSCFSLGYFLTHKYNANWTTAYWIQCLQQAKNLATLQFLFLIVVLRLADVWRAWHLNQSLKIKQGLYILACLFNNNLSLRNDSEKAGMAMLPLQSTLLLYSYWPQWLSFLQKAVLLASFPSAFWAYSAFKGSTHAFKL